MKIRFQKWFILVSIGLLVSEIALAILPPIIPLTYEESKQFASNTSDRWLKQKLELYNKIVEVLNRGELGNRQQLTKESQYVLSWKQLFQNNVLDLWALGSFQGLHNQWIVNLSTMIPFIEDNHSDCNRRVLAVGVSFRPPYGLS